MTKGKPRGIRRSASQIIRDRRRIGDLYLQGWLQCDIAEEVGVSQSTVSNDLKTLHEEWLEASLMDINEAKSRELAKLDRLECEYSKGWLRSCEDEVTTTEKHYQSDGENRVDITIKRKPRAGNTKFLDGIINCVKQRCKILGVEAPTEHEVGPRLGTILGALPDSFKAGVLEVLSSEGEKK